MGIGAAEEVLPVVQFRIASSGDGQRSEYFAGRAAQLSAWRRIPLFASELGARGFVAGGAGFAAVCHAMEMGRGPGAGAAAVSRRKESAPTDSADSSG